MFLRIMGNFQEFQHLSKDFEFIVPDLFKNK